MVALGLAAGRVRLVSSHGEWADEFAREKTAIVAAMDGLALGIEHVGSTAVAGIPAKPILDVLVGVQSFERAATTIGPLEALGYQYRGEFGIARRHYFVKGDPRTHHLHMVEITSTDWRKTVVFRDLLRSDAVARREYADAKMQLAAMYAEDRSSYQQEKNRVIERILREAGRS